MVDEQKNPRHEEEEKQETKAFQETSYSEDAILTQISEEFSEGLEFVREKREVFRTRLKLYNNQRKQRDKIGVTTLYNVMNTLLAVYYTDDLAVSFGGKGIAGTGIAENLEKLAKSDQEDMDMDVINYLTQWDRFFFGVGIRAVHGFDFDNQVPYVESYDPFSWIPDPQMTLKPNSARFMGFEIEALKSDMTEERGFFDTDKLSYVGKNAQRSDENAQTMEAYRDAQGLSTTDRLLAGRNGLDKKKYAGEVYNMVNWYTIIDGKRYLITCDAEFKKIVRMEHIKPVFKKEKKNELLTPWGVALSYYSPSRVDPFGTSVADLVEDKQRAKSVIANLNVAAVKAALYPMYLYNRQKILNRRDLDFSFNKAIGVNGDPNGSVLPLNKDATRIGEAQNTSQMLDRETSLSTGASEAQQGVMSDTSRTLGEVQQVQANANIRFALGNKINNIGEKDFWMLWYRCYVQFFPKAEAKMVEVTNAFGAQSITMYGKQFISEKSPRIIIRSKLESKNTMERERVAFAAISPIILQDPTRPMVSRRYTERHMLKLHGLDPEQVNIMIPPDPDEMTAHQENELLARNELPKISIDEDHLSHIAIHLTAPDTNATRQHISAHRVAYKRSGQKAKDDEMRRQAMAGGAGNTSANIAQNTIASQNASQSRSVPNVPASSTGAQG